MSQSGLSNKPAGPDDFEVDKLESAPEHKITLKQLLHSYIETSLEARSSSLDRAWTRLNKSTSSQQVKECVKIALNRESQDLAEASSESSCYTLKSIICELVFQK